MAEVKLAAFALLTSVLLLRCQAVKNNRVKAIEDRLIQFDDYFNAGKFEDIVDMWTDNGILVPNDGHVAIGKDAIRNFYNGFVGKGLQLVSVTTSVFGRGSFLSAYGECDVNNPDGSLFVHLRFEFITVDNTHMDSDRFRFIMNFQRIGKEWMIVGNVDNTGPRECPGC